MPVALTVTQEHDLGDVLLVRGTLVFSGNYATPGEALTWAGKIHSGGDPFDMFIHGEAGFLYEYDRSADLVKVRYFDYDAGADGAAIEIPDAAYPGGVTGDAVSFIAFAKKLV